MAPIEITRDNLSTTIEAGGIVVLDFWAAWCQPCHRFTPVFARVAETHDDITFGTVNTDNEQELAAVFGVRSLPTVVVVRDGLVVFAEPGTLTARGLNRLIDSVRALDMDEVRTRLAMSGTQNRDQPRMTRT